MTFNIHAAKTNLSALVERVALGEEIVIAKAGKPVAKLVPCTPVAQRALGTLKGVISLGADFDAPLPPEIAEAFGASKG